MEYLKIIDIVARILGSETNDLKARHDRVDIVEVTMTLTGGTKLPYKMFPTRYETEMVFSKKDLSPEQYKRLLTKLEFEMEQNFMKNIRIRASDEAVEYKIHMAM